jgi:hypothetical protein
MKIGCHCGAVIFDQTDDLAHKGHLIPDQNWFETYDAMDAEVIDRLAAGEISKEDAYMQARRVISRFARTVYECRECGRLYIDDRHRDLQCYTPADNSAKEILRYKESKSEDA